MFQVLYLTSLNVKPQRQSKVNVVSKEGLGLAINPVESQLASHVSSRPRLHFLAYVPTSEQAPLHIVNEKREILGSNAFLVPRWGGVAIYNAKKVSIKSSCTQNVKTKCICFLFRRRRRKRWRWVRWWPRS